MARMSTDDSLGRDPRLDHLAELCGWTRRETAGCLQLDVWPLCYDRVTPNIPPGDIDRAANRNAVSPVKFAEGFSGALIECGFARPSTKDDLVYRWERDDGSVVDLEWRDAAWKGRVYLKGASDRIAYILKKQASGRVGGKRSAKSRGSNQAPLEAPLEAVLKHTSAELNPSDLPSASDLDHKSSAAPSAGGGYPAQAVLDKIQEHLGDVGVARALGGKQKRKSDDVTEAELASVRIVLEKLGAQNGVAYTNSPAHIRLIVGRLREGATELDLRAIVGFCASNWKGKPEMAEYLRPETLFGPKTITKYLDPARSWAAKKMGRPVQAVASEPKDDPPPPEPPWMPAAEAQ